MSVPITQQFLREFGAPRRLRGEFLRAFGAEGLITRDTCASLKIDSIFWLVDQVFSTRAMQKFDAMVASRGLVFPTKAERIARDNAIRNAFADAWNEDGE